MIKKRLGTSLAAMLASLLIVCGTATPAFAYSNEPEPDTGVVVVEETTEVETEASTEVIPEDNTENTSDITDENHDVSGMLTPDGSLTLVDDVDETDSQDLQFMTVTTRDGSYYYIIIDRSGSQDNVYFLNAVDAVDLMNLMSDEEKEQFTSEEEAEETVSPIIVDDQTDSDTDADQQESGDAVKSNQLASSLPILGIFLAFGALIAGGYYMLKIKPSKGKSSLDSDREFYDDDEYENEDEEDTSEADAEDAEDDEE